MCRDWITHIHLISYVRGIYSIMVRIRINRRYQYGTRNEEPQNRLMQLVRKLGLPQSSRYLTTAANLVPLVTGILSAYSKVAQSLRRNFDISHSDEPVAATAAVVRRHSFDVAVAVPTAK